MSCDSTFDLGNLDGTNGFKISGVVLGDDFGESISSAGDFNGDDIIDLMIGSTGLTSPGNSYIIFGGSDIGRSGSFDLSTLNGSNGFKVQGQNNFSQFGTSVSGAGDVNNDGVADLLFGANSSEGYVLYGGDDVGSSSLVDISDLNGDNGFQVFEQFNNVGQQVSNLGDFDNDGIDDFVVADPNDRSVGSVYVVYGKDEAQSNQAPEAVNDRFRGKADTRIFSDVLFNDGDPDGDLLTTRLVNNVRSGKLRFRSDGTFICRPNAGFSGRDRFVYEVSDGNGGTDRQESY